MAPDEATLDGLLRSANVDPAFCERLARYGALLLDANRQVNLTGAKDPPALLPHILDALTLAGDVRQTLVDVGSGGGLPGIVLGVATGARITLVEPTAKKAAFLERAVAELGLDGEVIAERAEIVARDGRYRGYFAFATARAVSRASTVAELTVPLLRIGGRAMLQRGTVEQRERQALEDAAPMLGAALIEDRALDGDRRILILEKRQATEQRFPRRNGVPQKRPLCF